MSKHVSRAAAAAVLCAAAAVVAWVAENREVVATGKIRVLVVYESADLVKLPPAQLAIFESKAVREYLKTHCVLEGDVPCFRFLDLSNKDAVDKESAEIKELAKRPHTKLPWETIAQGKRFYDGPLDADMDQFLARLKEYGGP